MTSLLEAEARAETGGPLPEPEVEALPPKSARMGELFGRTYRKRTITLLVVSVFTLPGFYGFNGWVPTLLVEHGFKTVESLTYTSIVSIGAIPGALLAWPFIDRLERKYAAGAIYVVIAILADPPPPRTHLQRRQHHSNEGRCPPLASGFCRLIEQRGNPGRRPAGGGEVSGLRDPSLQLGQPPGPRSRLAARRSRSWWNPGWVGVGEWEVVMARAEQVTEAVAWHGEGPCWHDPWGLAFVDMLRGDVLRLDPGSGEVSRHHVGSVAAVVRPRRHGGAVIAVERGFALVDPGQDTDEARYLGDLWSDTSIRMNEGGCDPDGRFYCGTMAYDQTPGAGTVYRLDPDGGTHTVLTGVTVSNGFGFSPDGGTAYYVDTPTGYIDAFDYSSRDGLTGRRHAVEVDGRPDGLTVDAEGYLWVALFGGGAVLRYRPDGHLDDRVELPVTRVTACALGGPDRRTLYITTSREGIDEGAQPQAGALFAAEVGVPGLPPLPYAG